MNLSRRDFFKAAGAAFATTMAFELSSQSEALAVEPAADWKLVNTEEYTNICCYCSGGCGVICSTREGELVNIEGDPDHPVNQGGLCPKGATMFQLRNVVDPSTREVIKNPNRRTRPMVRRPGASEWEDITWTTPSPRSRVGSRTRATPRSRRCPTASRSTVATASPAWAAASRTPRKSTSSTR